MADQTFNSRKLRGRIVEKYGTISNFSDSVGRNRSSVSMILNGKAEMDRQDIVLFCSALDIKDREIGDYFFTPEVT